MADYDLPSVADFLARYPAFGSVDSQLVDTFLVETRDGVDDSWSVDDFGPAAMALAAHRMSLEGIGVVTQTEKHQRAGVTSIKTGQFSASFSEAAVARAGRGDYASTVYGRRYVELLRKQGFGGARIVDGGNLLAAGWGPIARTADGSFLP